LLFFAFAYGFGAGVEKDEAGVLVVDGEADRAFVTEHVHYADEGAAFEKDFCAAEVGRKDGLRNGQAIVNEFDLRDFTVISPELELTRSADARIEGVVVLFDVMDLEGHERASPSILVSAGRRARLDIEILEDDDCVG
jgi:hypothetical protein